MMAIMNSKKGVLHTLSGLLKTFNPSAISWIICLSINSLIAVLTTTFCHLFKINLV
ncbi:hypothetical protein GGD38_006630 [Chitinophagaceae bacterium OAS944]|nr:hypothetical protein [Chitinophagaceae bacterium OAS944]